MLNTVVKQLEKIADCFPEKVAIREEDQIITFSEYKRSSRSIATNLKGYANKRGVIAVYLPKSIECLKVFMGVLYTGNCYCPIPFNSPKDRAKKIIDRLQPLCVITDKLNYEDVFDYVSEKSSVLLIEELSNTKCDDVYIEKSISNVIDTDPAYILFTSGSTGEPKGVTVPHRALIDYIQWSVEKFGLNEKTILASQAPFHFDASMPDIYTPIFTGAELVLIKEKLFMFPVKLVESLNRMHVNTLIWVPSALKILSKKVFEKYNLDYLKLVMFCGEVMPNRHLNIWRKYNPNVTFVNLYGPTEAVYASTYYIVDREFKDDEALPIGYPCTNTDILLLDSQDRIIDTLNMIGEICIRGSSLALGYYGDRENMAFVQNPQNQLYTDCIYRTGDLGFRNSNGELMYTGRKDTQIKHMGYRIELGEIEMAVSTIDFIVDSCVLYDEEKDEIVLFYEEKCVSELKCLVNRLDRLLPKYMIPNRFLRLDKMPHNLNGKIDRAYLKTLIN